MAKADIFVKLEADNYADLPVASTELVGVLVRVPLPVGQSIALASIVEEIVISISVEVVLNSA